jgi:DNA topoisomerase VI subunit B
MSTQREGGMSNNGNGATDRILTKSRVMEYLTLDGLTKMTGVPPDILDIYTLKELTDNALDAAELSNTPPKIEVTISRQADTLSIAVADRGAGISPDMVKEITNFERFGGTKYFIKKPTRGAQGNALMTIVGLVSALWRAQGRAVPPAIVFSSRGYRHEVSLCIDSVLEKASVSVESVKISDSDGGSDVDQNGTSITVFLPLSHSAWGEQDRYAQVIENFSLWNPHASFEFTYCAVGASPQSRTFPSTAKKAHRYIQDGYGSPHWYTLDDFEKLLFANVRALEESGESETTLDFCKRFKGCSSNRKEFTETLRKGMSKRLNEIRDPKTSERLFKILMDATTPPSASVLGEVGSDHIKSFAEQSNTKRFRASSTAPASHSSWKSL